MQNFTNTQYGSDWAKVVLNLGIFKLALFLKQVLRVWFGNIAVFLCINNNVNT